MMPPETEPWEQVDRAAAVRRERRREIELLVLGTVAIVAVLVVRFAPADRGDRIAFVVVGAVILTAVAAATVWFVTGVPRPDGQIPGSVPRSTCGGSTASAPPDGAGWANAGPATGRRVGALTSVGTAACRCGG